MTRPLPPLAAIIGAGPAGLMAAEYLSAKGIRVSVYDRMASPARKFLMAGRGGLNLTHSEDLDLFIARYGSAAQWLEPAIRAFPPSALRAWAEDLGQPTFIGSSGRVFPKAFKASPLLRAWLRRLDAQGVRFAFHRTWKGWDGAGRLLFEMPGGECERVKADAILLALGGASWPRLGSDGGWHSLLQQDGIACAPLRPANCGFVANWSPLFSARHAGQPLKPVMLGFNGRSVQGELMITQTGIEGGAVYALSAALREVIAAKSSAILTLDLRPGLAETELAARLNKPRGSQSLSSFLRKAGLSPAAIGLLREASGMKIPSGASELAALIKALPLTLTEPAGIARAISSAGGILRSELDDNFMLRAKPGVFAAGEMLDWEAPTGGYLLQGCFSTARAAAKGMENWLQRRNFAADAG